jgi:hypothetical protein
MSEKPFNTAKSFSTPDGSRPYRIAFVVLVAIVVIGVIIGVTVSHFAGNDEEASPPPSPTTAELHIERGTALGTAQVDGKIVCDSSHDPVKLVDDETITYKGIRVSTISNTSEYRIIFTDGDASGYDSVIVKGTVAATIPQAIPPAFVKQAVMKVSAFTEVRPIGYDIVLCASRSATKPGS